MNTESLITLDATNGVTLAASLAALNKDVRRRLRHALNALNERDDIDALIGCIREELDDRDSTAVGVLFCEHTEYSEGVCLDADGVVLFADGTTRTVEFTGADDLISDLFDGITHGFFVAVDLRTGEVWGGNLGRDPRRVFRVAEPTGAVVTA